jgi:hypothetical protein
MYRIELSPGEETVFRTIEELATGVRNGVISQRARIYHHASQKWLPIEFHPHYKKAIETLSSSSKTSPKAMAQPVPVGAGPAPLPAPILAPLPEPRHAPRPEPMQTPLSEPMHFPRPTLARSPRPTPVPAPRATPTPMPWETVKVHALAPRMESPLLHLPTLAYPEVTPAEEPVAHASPGRARARGRRRLQVAMAASVIIGCTFVVMRASARREVPEALVAPRPASISGTRPTPAPVDPPESSQKPRVPAAGKRINPNMASVPGPAFAPATIGPKPAVMKPPVIAPVKTPSAADSTPAIEPAPAAVDVSLPSLPQGDSLSTLPKSTTDSAALGRILRAVGGTRRAAKPAP